MSEGAGEQRSSGIAGWALHDAVLFRLEREHQPERDGGGHVDPQDLHGQDRQRCAENDGREDDEAFAHVGGQGPDDELGEVVEDPAAFFDGGFDGGEVVVGEHHVRGFLGDLGAAEAHGDADVGLLQRGRVVDAVAGHGHDVVAGLEAFDEAELLFG